MYAIFETGGKQYKVCAGDVLRIEKISGEAGTQVQFGNVLAFSDGEALQTGTPYLDAATINATITSVGRGDKVIIFKFKAKKDYRKKQGHRQPFTEIEIDNFTIGGKTVGEKPPKPEPKPEPEEEVVEDEAKPAKGKAPKAKKAKDDVKAEETAVEEPVTEDAAAEETVKKEKPEKAKAPKAEKAKEEPAAEEAPAEVADKEEKPKKAKAPKAEKAKEEPAAEETKVDASKMTKADIMAKLDELGVEYVKSAKKDELLALLETGKK